MVGMSKALFWPMFKAAWDASFTESNIQSAWQKTGIWPFYPDSMLVKVTRPLPTIHETLPDSIKTPQTAKAIRQFQKSYIRSPSTAKRNKLFSTNEQLAAKVSVQQHEIDNLLATIKL